MYPAGIILPLTIHSQNILPRQSVNRRLIREDTLTYPYTRTSNTSTSRPEYEFRIISTNSLKLFTRIFRSFTGEPEASF
jgi:hypothetical protein